MDNDMAKLGCSLWGKKGNVQGAIQASQVVETHKVFGEIGARYSFQPTFFIGAKVDSDQNVIAITRNQGSGKVYLLLRDIYH